MKNIKRLLAFMLAVLMIAGTVVIANADTVKFTDTEDHWAWKNGYIPYLVEKNVLNGYKQSDGTYIFKPDGEVTRAEFIKMLDETFGLTETKPVSFIDVSSTDWFCTYFQKAYAQGYLLDYGSSCDPNGKIKREEAISLLVRYLKLDAEQKASASTFSDYSQINAKYQDYVLEAIYAGLIDGYKQADGTYLFKPANTLTRAEALTILYRAAGCIYNNKNSFVRDSGAASTNNVITKGGVVVQDQTLSGRTIISEGAASDIVTFSNCTITGTIYVRGNAKVYFDKCTVDEVVVNSEGGISLLNTTNIASLTLNKKINVNVNKDTKVGTLTVNAGAPASKIIGGGDIDKINVKATNFSSEIMPADFEIVNGLKATFAGREYNGSSDDKLFTVDPYITSDKTDYYLEFTPTVGGSVYYYYTESYNVPSASEFDATYQKATFIGHAKIEKDKEASIKTYSIASLKDYSYIVIMIQNGTTKYQPIVISNSSNASNGFSTDPYYSDTDTTVKFKVATNGTVYWFYTESSEALTQSKFLKEYANCEAALKGTVPATTKAVASIKLSSAYQAKYDYVAVQLKAADGSYYAPVIVPVAENGFAKVPEIKTSGILSFKSSVAGTLYYYYSKTEEVPTISGFDKAWKAATYSGKVNVTKNAADELTYKSSYASVYPYMVVCLKDTDGNYKLPILIELGYESGFISMPKLVSDSLISFTTSVAGTVQYYFTSSNAAPTIEQFKLIYASFQSDLKYKYSAYVPGTEGLVTIPANGVKNTDYVVLMMTDTSGNSFAPIILPLKYDPNDNITGFVYNPYIKNGEVYIKTQASTMVRYFYTNEDREFSSTDFYANYNKASVTYKGEIPTSANQLSKLAIDKYGAFLYRYIVLSVYNGSVYSEPIVLYASQNTERPGDTVGFKYTLFNNNALAVTATYTGKLYYYTTDSADEAASASFDKSKAASQEIEATKSFTINFDSKRYIVMAFEANDSLFDKVAYDCTNKKEFTLEKYDDGSKTSTTGINFNNNTTDHILTYQTSIFGSNVYVYFTLVGDNEIISYQGVKSKANVWSAQPMDNSSLTYDYTAVYNYANSTDCDSYAHVYLYVQLFDLHNMTSYKSLEITLK